MIEYVLVVHLLLLIMPWLVTSIVHGRGDEEESVPCQSNSRLIERPTTRQGVSPSGRLRRASASWIDRDPGI